MDGMWNFIGIPEPYGGYGYELTGFGVGRSWVTESPARPAVDPPEPDCCGRCEACQA